MRYGNMEIKKQTQVFVTVSYLEKISELSTKTFLERTYFLDGYFACSVGNVSEEMLRKYIENQG